MLELQAWRLVAILSALAGPAVSLLVKYAAHILLIENVILSSHLSSIILATNFVDSWPG